MVMSGDVTYDGVNQYLYDAEGRICAVASTPVPSMTVLTGYLYDADGTRVAKGTITSWSCDPTANGFTTTNDYVLGPGGEQVTEMGMGGASNGSTEKGDMIPIPPMRKPRNHDTCESCHKRTIA